MPDALPDIQWQAIRELCEGELPTHPRVARAAGIYVKTISRRAGADGWKTLDFRFKRVGAAHRAMIRLAADARAGHALDRVDEDPALLPALEEEAAAVEAQPLSDLPPAERIARMGAILARRAEAMLMKVEAGQPLEGRQVAALAALVQLAERIAVLAREEAATERAKSDESLADILEQIDRRIVELSIEGVRFMLVHMFGVDPGWVEIHLPEAHRLEVGPDGRTADGDEVEAEEEAERTPPPRRDGTLLPRRGEWDGTRPPAPGRTPLTLR